jgi:hypothetical protein
MRGDTGEEDLASFEIEKEQDKNRRSVMVSAEKKSHASVLPA